LFLLPLAACQGLSSSSSRTSHTVSNSVRVPSTIERLAILHPKTYDRELTSTYSRLEGATFQLKELRQSLRIVDRFDIQTILSEQRFQMEGSVSEETAIKVGKLLGVDTVLLYRVDGPTARDRVFAEFHGELPPLLIMSKILMVESAEVVFHNVVTIPLENMNEDRRSFYSGLYLQAALDRGIAQTIADLQHAFRTD
jgi:hypothetical protein